MQRTEIKVIRKRYKATSSWPAHVEHQAWCTRCHNWCQSSGGNVCWSTKAPAERAAELHLQMHQRCDSEPQVDRMINHYGWEMVTEFTNEDLSDFASAVPAER